MIEKDSAVAVARSFISSLKVKGGNDLILVEGKTIEKPFGWVFFYNSKKFLETKDIMYAVLGNAPLIVARDDGSVHLTGTARTIDYYIQEYEKSAQGPGKLKE